jgi:hypothetical protein
MRTTPDPLAGPIACDGCNHVIWWPRWAPNGGGDYFCLCDRCYYQRGVQFTIDAAILEALAIVASTPIVIRPRVKVGPR